MIDQMYLAAQYLAASGISFLEKKDDDSHTNLGFSVEKGSMYTRPLNNAGDTLALNYNTFALVWNMTNANISFDLQGTTHEEIIKWITQMASNNGIAIPYSYKFHYEPSYKLTDGFTFKLVNPKRLRELMDFRILTQKVIASFLKRQNLVSEIRTWPHHFDTGAFAQVPDKKELSVGLGLAIPDTLVNDHYFYLSGYLGHDTIDCSGFQPLAQGKWYPHEFKGAILPATGINEKTATVFFQEALKAYKN
ncbi:MAG: hypothetical protein WBG90_04235 [Saonia sp.]